MARHRLRFLLQEFDVSGPSIEIGRSPDCNVTIEDPLVSRRHARITVSGDRVTIEDLGSRNGVRVNGDRIEGPTELRHRDRVRLGAQDMVFLTVGQGNDESRDTGFLGVCHSCGTPFPDEALSCPHCGAAHMSDETSTASGVAVEPRSDWSLSLLCDVLERALRDGRSKEAAQLMRRVERHFALRSAPPGADTGERIASLALELALRGPPNLDWVAWAVQLHMELEILPPDHTWTRVERLAETYPLEVSRHVDMLCRWVRGQAGDVPAAVGRLEEQLANY